MRRNKKAYEADLGRLNDAIWRFTNHANREVVSAVDAVCSGGDLAAVQAEAEKHSVEARKAWAEAAKLAEHIWSEIKKQAKKEEQA